MSNTLLRTAALTTLLLSVTLTGCQTAPSAPEDEAQVARAPAEIQRMARKNDCFKCHAVTREKDGPSWHSVAEKYRDKANARERLQRHLTTGPIIELKGDPEKHKQVKELTELEVRQLVDWILSL